MTVRTDVHKDVAGFTASGKVTKADYDTIVIPAIDELVKQQGKLDFCSCWVRSWIILVSVQLQKI